MKTPPSGNTIEMPPPRKSPRSLRNFYNSTTAAFSFAAVILIGIENSIAQNHVIVTDSDTSVTSYNPTGSIVGLAGGSPTFAWLDAAAGPGYNGQSLVHFDTAALAPGSYVVTKAQLWLNFDRGETSNLSLYTVDAGFDWRTVQPTWNSTSGGLNTGDELSSLLLTSGTMTGATWYGAGIVPGGLYFELPVSSIQGWIDTPSTNNGLAILDDTGNAIPTRFVSLEHGIVANAPTLLLWTTAVPEPSGCVLLAAGTLVLVRRRRTSEFC